MRYLSGDPRLRLSRRQLLSATGLLVGSGLLAACGQPAPSPTTAPAKAAEPTKPAAAAATTAPAPTTAAAAPPTTAPAAPVPTASGKPAEATKPAAAQPTAAPAAAPAGQPKPGGATVWAAESDPVSLNPITNSAFQSTQGFEHCYESLFAFDWKLQIQPALAERYETPDPTTYIIYLRKGVKFHNGQEMTAEDVKYTFDIVINPQGTAGWRANFGQVDRVEIVDKYTVKFITKTPFPPLIGAFAILRSSAVLPKGAMDTVKLGTQAIGTGPYKLVEYVPKSHVKLAKNKEYWGAPQPYYDDVTFKILEDEESRVAGLRGGSLDYALLTAEGKERLKNEQGITIHSGPRIYNYVLIFNARRQPWFDPKVRQAINMAIDRKEIADKVFSGGFTIGGPIPPNYGAWSIPPDEITSKWYKYDPDKAKALLKEAGVSEGQPLDFVVTAFNQSFPGLGVVVAEQLKKVGINVKIRQLETGVFIKETSAEGNFNYDFQPNAFTPRHDPDGFVWPFHSSTGGYPGYKNDTLDDLLTKGRTTVDPAKRKEYYDEVQRILLTDVPAVWLGVDHLNEGVRNTIKNYTQSPFTRRDWALKNTWLEK